MPEAKHTESLPTVAAPPQESPLVGTADLMLQGDALTKMERFADLMAKSKVTVPAHFRNSPGDCFAVAMQAAQWGMNPFVVAQKTHITQGGQLGYEAQLISAVVTTRGPVVGRPDYEFIGDWSKILGKVEEKTGSGGGKYYAPAWKKPDEEGLGVVIRWQLQGEHQPREMTIMLTQCYPRFSTQWATDPQQQITYVAVRKFARRFCPDSILGVYTRDELEDTEPRDMGMAMRVDERPAAPARRSEPKPKSQPKAAEPASKLAEGELVDDDQGAPEIPETITDGMLRTLRSSIERLGADETSLCLHFKIGTIEELPKTKINEAMEFVRSGAEG